MAARPQSEDKADNWLIAKRLAMLLWASTNRKTINAERRKENFASPLSWG